MSSFPARWGVTVLPVAQADRQPVEQRPEVVAAVGLLSQVGRLPVAVRLVAV